MTQDTKLALFHLLTDLQTANLDYICALTVVIEHIDERISAIDTLLRVRNGVIANMYPRTFNEFYEQHPDIIRLIIIKSRWTDFDDVADLEQEILSEMLRKNVVEKFNPDLYDKGVTTALFMAYIKNCATTTLAAPATFARRDHWRLGLTIAAATVAVVALAAWGIWHWMHRAIPGDHHEVVLADFENSTGDPDFEPALKTLLSMDLNESPYLVVAGDANTGTILKLMNRSPDDLLTPVLAREVCQRLNDQVVLSGLIARFGQKYLVTLTATDCSDGRDLVRSKAVADNREGVLKAVDFVAADMRKRLGEPLKSLQRSGPPLEMAHTFSLDALRAYSQALPLCSAGKRQAAIPLYQRAIELDPRFAAAYLDMGRCYVGLREFQLGRAAITKAYDLRDQGDDLLRLRILATYGDLVTGDMHAQLRTATEWTELYPNQAQAWMDLAGQQQGLSHPELGIEPAKRALVLAPDDGSAYATLCGVLKDAGRPEEAKSICREAIHRKIDNSTIHFVLWGIALAQQDVRTMQEQVAWFKGTDDEVSLLDYLLLAEGKIHAAEVEWLQNIDREKKAGLNEMADRRNRILMRREADYSMDAELKRHLATIDPDKYPLNVVIANAELGRVAAAESGLKIYAATVGSDTTDRYVHLPELQAAVALARHQPEEAIADLEIARPHDLKSPETVLMRGRAYLAARQPKQAEGEFREVIDHPYIAPGEPSTPLAHLGLARALEMDGNHAAARQEYQALFEIWKDADADLPPLVQARLEYARLSK